MSTRDRMTQFPPNAKSNPGKTDIQEDREKQKLTQEKKHDKLPQQPPKPDADELAKAPSP